MSRINPNIMVAGALSGVLLGGCSTGTMPSHAPKAAAVSYNCDPRLDKNYVKIPPEVSQELKLPFVVVSSRLGSLTIMYERDCGTDVRGPVTTHFPLGPLLTSSFCEASGKTVLFRSDLELDNQLTPSTEHIPEDLIQQTHQLEPKLTAARTCADHIIRPLGVVEQLPVV